MKVFQLCSFSKSFCYSVFLISMYILGKIYQLLQKILLELWQRLSWIYRSLWRAIILTILSLPINECGMSLYLFRLYLIFLSNVLKTLLYKFCTSFAKFIFISLSNLVNGIVCSHMQKYNIFPYINLVFCNLTDLLQF